MDALADLVPITTAMDPTDWANLEHLLTSNIAPLPHQPAIVQRIINELDTKLTTVDQRISSLQQELKQLVARRPVIEDHRRRCASILSARRRLPPEVTQAIMNILWKRAHYGDSLLQPSQSPIPRLMLVSREWHNIALATPHFWASLHLIFRPPIETLVKGASIWLSRAQSHPLLLKILVTVADSYQTCFVQFLEEWAQRIAVLEFTAFQPSLEMSRPNLPLQNVIWPELHTLSVNNRLYPLTGGGSHHRFIDHKSSARFPALRNLEIQTMVTEPTISMAGILWGNLVSLKVYIDYRANDNDNNNRYLAMLRECSGHLQELSMTVCRHMPLPLKGWTEPIIFPHLTRLRITPNVDLMGEEWIVGYLRFPAVRSITYHLYVSDGIISNTRNPIDAIASLIRSFGATKSVQYFELHDRRARLAGGPNVRMKELFEDLQNLEDLRISTYRCDFEGLGDIPKCVRSVHVAVKNFDLKDREAKESEWLKLEERLRKLSGTRRDLGCPLEVVLEIGGQLKEIA